jgi:hypothetical protein
VRFFEVFHQKLHDIEVSMMFIFDILFLACLIELAIINNILWWKSEQIVKNILMEMFNLKEQFYLGHL